MSTMNIPNDVVVQGSLSVTGTKPPYARSELTQHDNAVFAVPLTLFRTWDALATNLPATPANDDLGLVTGTLGTDGPSLQTGDLKAAGSTTRYARVQVRLPAEYVSGQTVTVRASAGMLTTVADVAATLDVQAYRVERDGGVGSDLCSTSAQDINDLTLANMDFNITATTLTPGDLLDIRLAVLVNDGATVTAVTGIVAAVELLCDIKG